MFININKVVLTVCSTVYYKRITAYSGKHMQPVNRFSSRSSVLFKTKARGVYSYHNLKYIQVYWSVVTINALNN